MLPPIIPQPFAQQKLQQISVYFKITDTEEFKGRNGPFLKDKSFAKNKLLEFSDFCCFEVLAFANIFVVSCVLLYAN